MSDPEFSQRDEDLAARLHEYVEHEMKPEKVLADPLAAARNLYRFLFIFEDQAFRSFPSDPERYFHHVHLAFSALREALWDRQILEEIDPQ